MEELLVGIRGMCKVLLGYVWGLLGYVWVLLKNNGVTRAGVDRKRGGGGGGICLDIFFSYK